jgi:hypothetical protein
MYIRHGNIGIEIFSSLILCCFGWHAKQGTQVLPGDDSAL